MLELKANQKEYRFKLIEQALELVIKPLQGLLLKEDLGFDEEAQAQYLKLKNKTSSIYEHLNFLANKSIEIYKEHTNESFWAAYEPLLIEAQDKSELEYKEKYEKKHIDNAIQNAFYFFYGLYAILPKIYWNTFKKQLDQKTFKKLVLNSNKFAKVMSIIHFDMFRSFLYSSTQTKTGVATQLHMFMDDTFVISDELEISLSEAALARAKKHTKRLLDENKASIDKNNPTIGCPAKFVKLEADKDLIDLLHQWVVRLSDKYFFE